MQHLNQLDKILKEAKNVAITSHISPDPDAICSTLLMSIYLSKFYNHINYKCLITETSIESLNSLPLISRITWVNNLNNNLQNIDTIIFVDASDLKRFTTDYANLDISKFKTICIDHHNNLIPEYNFSAIDYSEPSCTQYIYKHLFKPNSLLTTDIAEIVLTGILSDTAMLKYTKQRFKETYDLVIELSDYLKTDIYTLENKHLSLTKNHIELFTELVKNIKYVNNGNFNFAYSYLEKDTLNKFSSSVLEQSKDFFLQLFAQKLNGYGFMFIVKPFSKNIVNISFRSNLNSINVRLLAEKFEGGGHDLRSGAKHKIEESESVLDVCKIIEQKILSFNLNDFKFI